MVLVFMYLFLILMVFIFIFYCLLAAQSRFIDEIGGIYF